MSEVMNVGVMNVGQSKALRVWHWMKLDWILLRKLVLAMLKKGFKAFTKDCIGLIVLC